MARKLPTVTYGKRRCTVDFRLEELRCGKELKRIPFTKLPGGPKSRIKKRLRKIRFRTSDAVYIKGLDD